MVWRLFSTNQGIDRVTATAEIEKSRAPEAVTWESCEYSRQEEKSLRHRQREVRLEFPLPHSAGEFGLLVWASISRRDATRGFGQ
jgi:hypothetical protein